MEMDKEKNFDLSAMEKALRSAIRSGKVDRVERLLGLGANPSEPLARRGQVATALGYAILVEKFNLQIVEMLLRAGVDPWAAADGNLWVDAWHLAIRDGKSDCVKLMAEAFSKDLRLPPVWEEMDKKTRSLNRDCPLSRCLKIGVPNACHARCIEVLAPHCDIEACDGWGITPLMHAARIGFEEGVAVLIAAGANPNMTGNTGVSPLMMASKTDSMCMEILLEAGADPLAVDESMATALHWAAKRGSAKGMRILSERSDLGAMDVAGRRPAECVTSKASASTKAMAEWLDLKRESKGSELSGALSKCSKIARI